MMQGSKVLQWLFVFLGMAFLQTTIVQSIAIAGIVPDVVLIALFLFSIRYGRLGGIWVGFFLGLLLDVYSSSGFGVLALAYTFAGAFLGFFEQRKLAVDPLTQVMLVFFSSILVEGVVHFATFGFADFTLFSIDKLMILSRAVYTAIIATLVLGIKYYVLPSRSR